MDAQQKEYFETLLQQMMSQRDQAANAAAEATAKMIIVDRRLGEAHKQIAALRIEIIELTPPASTPIEEALPASAPDIRHRSLKPVAN
jgi:hypothetical protein